MDAERIVRIIEIHVYVCVIAQNNISEKRTNKSEEKKQKHHMNKVNNNCFKSVKY